MGVITIISDWQYEDFYLPALKGKIYSLQPDANVVDLCHSIKPFDSHRAALILKSAYKTFPQGSIHMICMHSVATKLRPHLVISYKGHFFISAENEILGILFDDYPDKVIKLEHSAITTFPEYDIFVEAAVFLNNKGNIDELGSEYKLQNFNVKFLPNFYNDIITGMVLFIDSYGNLITNINKKFFYEKVGNHAFEILLKEKFYSIDKISTSYTEEAKDNLFALFNSLGLLEIGLVYGRLAPIIKIMPDDEVIIKIYFNEPKITHPLLKNK